MAKRPILEATPRKYAIGSGRQQRAGDMLVEAIAIMDELLSFVKHTGQCPHPRGPCTCGLPKVLVKARRFGVFLSLLLLTSCTIPFGEKSRQQKAMLAMERAASPVRAEVQAVVSRPAQSQAIVNVPHDHTVAVLPSPTLTLEEVIDRFRTNRQAMTILITTPVTNVPSAMMMPRRMR